MNSKLARLFVLLLIACLMVACAADGQADSSFTDNPPTLQPVSLAPNEKLQVVASTTIIADVVAQVGGDAIDLTTLMAIGQEPHSFEPAPADIAAIEGADVMFANGFGLEAQLLAVAEPLARRAPVVPLSEGITPRRAEDGDEDPHVWLDPNNVVVWTETISATLSTLDPANAESYAAHASAYHAELEKLDDDIREQVALIPPEKRKLVTNHDALGYFADRYGFEVIGTVFAGASDLAEPSAGQMAALVATLETQGVDAIFVETTVSPQLADVVAEELGGDAHVVTLYTGSLGEAGSGAETYLDMMRLNVERIVTALR